MQTRRPIMYMPNSRTEVEYVEYNRVSRVTIIYSQLDMGHSIRV